MTHPVPDVVRFTRVGHVLTVRHLCLVDIVTARHCPQRQQRYKVETEKENEQEWTEDYQCSLIAFHWLIGLHRGCK